VDKNPGKKKDKGEGKNTGPKKKRLIDAVRQSMLEEKEANKWLIIDTKDGAYENKRAAKLIQLGVLTYTNAPGIVPPPTPPEGTAWSFLQREDLKMMDCMAMLFKWNDLWYTSYAKRSSNLQKANNKVLARKAYHVQVAKVDDIMFVKGKVDRSQVKETLSAMVAFRVPVGRDSSFKSHIISARCFSTGTPCTAGANCPACNHILTLLTVLVKVQQGTIKAGEVGDDEKSWGAGSKDSTVPVQSVRDISILTGGQLLASFTGLRPDCPADVFAEKLPRYIQLFQQKASSAVPPTIVEIHNGAKILRGGERQEPRSRPPGATSVFRQKRYNSPV
jgi:hypothetical protein